jgi:hypothetical protein
LKKWRTERDRLAVERAVLSRKYATFKGEVRDVETDRKYTEEVAGQKEGKKMVPLFCLLLLKNGIYSVGNRLK